MKPRIDLQGQRFGRLVAIEWIQAQGGARWLCKCDCGQNKTILANDLRQGKTISCGCHKAAIAKARMTRHGHTSWRGGHSATYSSWNSAKNRCHQPSNKNFADYGGRGITMCDEWRNDFSAFLRDMGERSDGLELDRIDNSLGYQPGNCRWTTRSVNMFNTRRSVHLTWNGTTKNLEEWAQELGFTYEMLNSRWLKGWSVERILTQPKGVRVETRKRARRGTSAHYLATHPQPET